MPAGAARLAGQCGRGVWVGYSMGGRLCLHVALEHPSVVDGLVLVGATAGIADPQERARRRHDDERLATRIEQEGVEQFLAEWLARPMFAGLPDDPSDREDRRRNGAAGLAGALRLAGTGAQEPLWHRLADLAVLGIPVLVVAGELDEKFKVEARRLAAGIGPTARMRWVPGAGHAAHLERPDEFLAILRAFLDELADRP